MSELSVNALIAQGGGPTAVINQSLVGTILKLRGSNKVNKIYGARYGVRGILNENFIDLTEIELGKLELIAQTPGSALGSTRDKPDKEYCEKMFDIMKKNSIKYFFYIGGNDSADTCRIINEEAQAANYELRVIHVPKTIDNDLRITDHCPGFGSAARFVAQAFMSIDLDNASLPGVFIGVVMGRHAGFLTASSILGKKNEADGPHLVYTPEKPFNIHYFIRDVKEVYERYGRCVVAVSEGIRDEDGVPIATKLAKQVEQDAHGNVQLSGNGVLGDLLADAIKSHTGISRVRVDTFGYLQRSFIGCVSEVDAKEARMVGEKAAEFALSEDIDGSVVIIREKDYNIEYKLVPLFELAAKTKKMPDEFFINDNMISNEFTKYAAPLVGELPNIIKI